MYLWLSFFIIYLCSVETMSVLRISWGSHCQARCGGACRGAASSSPRVGGAPTTGLTRLLEVDLWLGRFAAFQRKGMTSWGAVDDMSEGGVAGERGRPGGTCVDGSPPGRTLSHQSCLGGRGGGQVGGGNERVAAAMVDEGR